MPRNTRNLSAERIKACRKLRGLKQEQLAARIADVAGDLGILAGWVPSRDSIERWEAGAKIVTDQHLRLLSVALNVDPRWLIGDPAGEPPKVSRRSK